MTSTDDAFVEGVPEARVCRTCRGRDHKNTLVPRDAGWLAVRVYFHREPISDLQVEFHAWDNDEWPGARIGPVVRSDDNGIAKLDFLVPVGTYFCLIEDQEPALVSTVESPDVPLELVLPIGRPYFDFEGECEFDEEDTPSP